MVIRLLSHRLNVSITAIAESVAVPIAKLTVSTALLTWGWQTLPANAESKIYNPPSITSEQVISDTLTENDIPTGEGGFARDYYVQLQKGDQISIDLTSDNFDSMVVLIAADGATVAENDDGPDGTTNSLLFSRINEAGKYIVRVRAFGETSGGKFTLKLTRLKPTAK
ncbi:MAG: PPC domain-containing protein [Waterburya sp.]